MDADFYLGLSRVDTLPTGEKVLKKGTLLPEFYSEVYDEGTLCDLTGEPRETTVNFYCSTETHAFSAIQASVAPTTVH